MIAVTSLPPAPCGAGFGILDYSRNLMANVTLNRQIRIVTIMASSFLLATDMIIIWLYICS